MGFLHNIKSLTNTIEGSLIAKVGALGIYRQDLALKVGGMLAQAICVQDICGPIYPRDPQRRSRRNVNHFKSKRVLARLIISA